MAMAESGAVQDHMDRVITVPYLVRANAAKSPWASGVSGTLACLGSAEISCSIRLRF